MVRNKIPVIGIPKGVTSIVKYRFVIILKKENVHTFVTVFLQFMKQIYVVHLLLRI